MADVEQDQLVSDVARQMIKQIAPEELPLYRAQSQAYFANPAAALRGEASKDEMLGFGAGEVIIFLTPIALQVASQAVAILSEELKKASKEQSAPLIRAMVRRLLHGDARSDGPAQNPPSLTSEQLRRVREAALEEARRCRVSDDRANLLADAIAGRLAASA
jgi:hypothetical protein